MSSEAEFVIAGVKFGTSEWTTLIGSFLIFLGIAITIYISLFIGSAEKAEASKTEVKPAVKVVAAKSTSSRSTTPSGRSSRSTTPAKKAAIPAPPTPKSTSKRTASKNKGAESDLGHVLSPDGRRSTRLRKTASRDD
ncbi:hypothetical protein B484DRAFT_395032 [Ochromonadaceae sp. CCMP2298]|nr:hypothetical protein B484DRAFT_395032 [Ochromonadaceae sp. CCMP2298]